MNTSQRKSEEFTLYEALFNNNAFGIILVNQSGEITALNFNAVQLFKYSSDELKSQMIDKLIPNKYHANLFTFHKNHLKYGTGDGSYSWREIIAVDKNGEIFPVEIYIRRFKVKGKEVTALFVKDITRQKKMEAEIVKLTNELQMEILDRNRVLHEMVIELSESRNKLALSQQYQKLLFDNAGVMIVAMDKNGGILQVNPETVAKTGFLQSELEYIESILLFHDPFELEYKRKCLFREYGVIVSGKFGVLVEKANRYIHEEEEYTYIRKNNTRFQVSVTVTAIRDNMGEITGYLSIAVDISLRKKSERALQAAFDQEIKMNELKTSFVSMASHEFRTPICAIATSAFLAGKYMQNPELGEAEKYLTRIKIAADLLIDILDDLIKTGKIEEGKVFVHSSCFNISDLVRLVIKDTQDKLNIKQEISYTHLGNPEIFLDALIFSHIIEHLLSNAAKFSSDNSVIEIKTVCVDTSMILSVKDNGIGIPYDEHAFLIQRYYRGSNALNIPGTGLGLYIVQKCTELLLGTLSFISEPGKGSEFCIQFTSKNDI